MNLYTRKFLLFFILIFAAMESKALTANFTEDYLSGCSPLVVHFTNTSTGATSYYWDLGNGTTSSLTDVSGSYITPGTYTVILTSYNGSSSTTHSVTITVYPSPVVSFYASDTGLCPGSSTTFTSTSTAGTSGACTYLWNFGDGSSSTAASPTHAYTSPGYYNVTLVVTNSMGCSTSLTTGAMIHVYNHSNPGFTSTITHFCNPPGTAVFTNTTTGATPFTYAWSFGDGGTSTSTSPTHTYTGSGSYTVKLIVTDANGCIDSFIRTNYISVVTTTTSFTYTTTACSNTPVTFYNTSSSHISSSWNFGDGGTATTDTGVHSYSSAGTYTVRLIIFNGSCYDTVVHSITILPPPTASFTYSPTNPCPSPVTIGFTGTVPVGGSVTWVWGDGTSTTGGTGSTTHTYTSNRMDTVYMTVVDINGCVATVNHIIGIYDLEAHIVPTATSGCIPLVDSFRAGAETHVPGPSVLPYPFGITSYTWNFGDGSATATGANPAHTYTAVGIYHCVVTIVTSNGCSTTDTVEIMVGTPPRILVTATPSHVCYHDPVHFTVFDSTGMANSYYWDFHDGTTITDTFHNMTHTFYSPGMDSIYVIAYYNGCPSTRYMLTGIVVDSPKAIIVDRFDCAGTTVHFYDSSLGDDTHLWMFGDGGTSTLDTPVHTYSTASTYIVTLCTYNATSGCRDTARLPINLIPPTMGMTATDSLACAGTVVTFSPISDTATTQWYWYDQRAPSTTWHLVDADTAASFNDTFYNSGIYSIKLLIRDGRGCYDTMIRTNWIKIAKPVDSFTASPVTGCGPLTVTFVDHSYDIAGVSITNYSWAFGDGTTATLTSPTVTHTYTAAGTYGVTEIVKDNVACIDTQVNPAMITVWRPHASGTTGTYYPCVGSTVHFTNYSTAYSGVLWMFGDGDTSSTLSPNHIYTAAGTYTVKLIAFDSHGCSDTANYINFITVSAPSAAFTMSDSFTICAPITVAFYNGSSGATYYNWSFGDGGTSVLVSPSDLYTSSGYYTVRLVAFDTHGCTDTAFRHVNVYGYAGAFHYSPLTGCSPLTVNFGAALTNVPNIIWDFADGTTSATSYNDSAHHTYVVPGAYVPKLILSDNSGCQNSSLGLDTIKVDVVRPGFTTNPHPICVSTNVAFIDTSFSYFSTISSWHWDFGGGDTSNLASPPYFYSVTGTYPVTLNVTDGWGCTGSISTTVNVYPPPVIKASPDTIICVGDAATLYASGGVKYTWTPPATLGCSTCQTTSASPVVVTTYTVTGIDGYGCVNTDSVTVSLRTNTISRGWGDTEICRNTGVPLFDTGGTKYTWIPTTGLSNPTISNPIATPDYTTTYTVIAQYGGCIPDTNYVTVIVHQIPTVDAGPNQTLVAGSIAYLQATGTLIAKYEWSPAQTLSCETCANPIARMVNSTLYTVTVKSSFGCLASDTVRITLYCDQSQIFIPNSFTPNGDGENDIFYPRGSGVKQVNAFRIYNRWGNLLFEKKNITMNDASMGWDGTSGGATPRPDVYVYMLDAVCDTGEPIFIKGDVTIIK